MSKLKAIIKNFLATFFYYLQKRYRFVSEKPTEVHLLSTEHCCLQCKMCDIWKIKGRRQVLSFKQAKKIIDQLSQWLGSFHLTLAGGEPFLNQDLTEIIKYANQKQIKVNLNTNGFVIEEKLAQKIASSGLKNIFFSLDGLQKEHDYIRGRNQAFQRAVEAINHLQKYRKNCQPKIFINTVISSNNLNQLPKLARLALGLKIDGINFQPLMPNFAHSYTQNWFESNPFWPKNKTEISQAIKKLVNLKKQHPAFILNSTQDFKNFLKYFLDPKKHQETATCFVGLNNLMVDTKGDVRLCYEMGVVGNLFKTYPQKIWLGKKAQVARKKIAECQKPCKLLPCNDQRLLHRLKQILKIKF